MIVKQLTENKIFEEEKYEMKRNNIQYHKSDIASFANRNDEPKHKL